MTCPECGAVLRNKDTRQSARDNRVYRERICPDCERRYYTCEIMITDKTLDKFRPVWRQLERTGIRRRKQRESKQLPADS